MNLNNLLKASAVVLMICLAACFGGGNSVAGGTLNAADFHKFLIADTSFTAVSGDTDKLKGQMGRIGLFGHVKSSAVSTQGRVTLAVAPSFGPCSDMGVLQGRAGGSNAMLGAIQSYQTCQDYEYSVSADTGAIQSFPGIEWSGAGCTGTAYAVPGQLNKQLVSNGAVVAVLSQGTNMYVAAGEGTVHFTHSSDEDDAGNCSDLPSPSTDTGYVMADNDPNVTGVPNSSIPVPFSNGAP